MANTCSVASSSSSSSPRSSAGASLTRSVESAGTAQVYVVQPGDTLWSIASERYAGDPREGVWKLQRRNQLPGTTISPGQKLVLP